MTTKHLILWDGECGFCRRTAHWFVSHDKTGTLTACAYQEAPSPPMTPTLFVACDSAVHIALADGTVLNAGRATLYLFECVGWGWLARILRIPPFAWGVEPLYRIIANNRTLFARFFFTQEPKN